MSIKILFTAPKLKIFHLKFTQFNTNAFVKTTTKFQFLLARYQSTYRSVDWINAHFFLFIGLVFVNYTQYRMKCAKHGATTANRFDMTVWNSFVVFVFSLSHTRSSVFSLFCLRPVTVLYAHGFDGINEFPNESACCTRVHAPSLTHSNAYTYSTARTMNSSICTKIHRQSVSSQGI